MPLGSKATTLSHVKLVLGLVAVAAGIFYSESAHAEDETEPLSVHWDAPASCPSEASLKQAVEADLGQPLNLARKQALSILASVSLGSAGYTARLRFQSPSGVEERTLEHPDCEKLMDATALVIALTIDSERVNAQQIKNNPDCKIAVIGYCSTNKSEQQLSWDRVNAVITYLVEKEGISSDRFIFKYGETGGDCATVDLRDGTGEEGPNTVPAPHPNLHRRN